MLVANFFALFIAGKVQKQLEGGRIHKKIK